MGIGGPTIFHTSALLSQLLWGVASLFMEKDHCQADFLDSIVRADKDKLRSHTAGRKSMSYVCTGSGAFHA